MNFLNFEKVIFGFIKKIYGIFGDNKTSISKVYLKKHYYFLSFELVIFGT